MELRHFEIKDLFGDIGHTIKFKNEGYVTYVIGRNGIGKTTLLKVLNAISKENFEYITELLFKEIILKFSDRTSLTFKKEQNKKGETQLFFEIKKGKKIKKSEIEVTFFEEGNITPLIDRLISLGKIKNRHCGHWTDVSNNEHINQREILERFGKGIYQAPAELNEITKNLNIVFLSSLRLGTDDDSEHINQCYKVRNIASDLKERLRVAQSTVLKNLEQVSDDLEKKLMGEGLSSFNDISKDDFNSLYKDYKDTSLRIENINFKADSYNEELIRSEHSDVERALLAYLLDKRLKAYEPYIDILFNTELFNDIVKNSFLRKTVQTSTDYGIMAADKKGRNFGLEKLSSGEQQVVSMAYTVLFGVQKNTFILIDEPELSMDIDWQRKFTDWLIKIADKRNLRFLLATHSPIILMNKKEFINTLTV